MVRMFGPDERLEKETDDQRSMVRDEQPPGRMLLSKRY